MKKRMLITMFATFAILCFAGFAQAQVSVDNVLKRAAAVVDKLESQESQILFMQIDTLEKGQISTLSYSLQAGSTYAIVAIGDADRIQDIDLAVVDDNAKVVGKDDDDENLAIVKVAPKATGSFKIGVKGYKMSRNDGFYAIVICRLD